MEAIGPVAKCAPPLRPLSDQAELLDAIDKLTTIGSDHSPAPPEMKQRANFFEVWGGISGCQHLLPLLCTLNLPEKKIGTLTSENVAQRFGIAAKGGLTIGNDADLTIVDLNDLESVTLESLHYRHKQSPYIGRKLPRAVRTILRGQTIFSDGKIAARPTGKLVRPHRS
jgi:allantoinase